MTRRTVPVIPADAASMTPQSIVEPVENIATPKFNISTAVTPSYTLKTGGYINELPPDDMEEPGGGSGGGSDDLFFDKEDDSDDDLFSSKVRGSMRNQKTSPQRVTPTTNRASYSQQGAKHQTSTTYLTGSSILKATDGQQVATPQALSNSAKSEAQQATNTPIPAKDIHSRPVQNLFGDFDDDDWDIPKPPKAKPVDAKSPVKTELEPTVSSPTKQAQNRMVDNAKNTPTSLFNSACIVCQGNSTSGQKQHDPRKPFPLMNEMSFLESVITRRATHSKTRPKKRAYDDGFGDYDYGNSSSEFGYVPPGFS